MRTLLAIAILSSATLARAAPEEIQVYMDEMTEPKQFGLDVHNSFVATGHTTANYTGEQQSLHRYRMTPEFALGVTSFLELGLYLPLATIDRDFGVGVDGVKLRVKFIAPRVTNQAWWLGANFEIGVVDHALDENPYNAELKGIAGVRSGPWTVAVNANFDFKVDGPVSAPASLDLDLKLGYRLARSLAAGVETYHGIGELRDLGAVGSSEHSTFAIIDVELGGWDLNLGVGTGYGANSDRLLFKAIVGIPID